MQPHPDSPLEEFFVSRQPQPSRFLDVRFDGAGRFLREPGNTIVCHVVPGSETQRAMVEARAKYLATPEGGRLAFTATSSLHMTLISGIIETGREATHWPADQTLDTPVETMTEILGARLDAAAPGSAFKVVVQRATPVGLQVGGATEADERIMRDWRNRVADVWGFRHPGHDDYPFHVTFSYLIDWLPDAALPRWRTMLDEVAADIRARTPVLELRAPAFCRYNDMNRFEELRVLPIA